MRIFYLTLGLTTLLTSAAYAQDQAPYTSGTISGLGARNIGSAAMSGRVSALAAHKQENGKTTLFVGAASGGVWKSEDGGTRYKPVFDEQPVQSIGAIALDPKNPKNVWVGTGESWTRNSVSIGDGIYRSTDGGDTWNHVGLKNSERVAFMMVSPKAGDTVFAAVPGPLWSDSEERGLFKTTDGGKTWNNVLKGPNLSTGASDIAMDPTNPDVMFASLWDFRRQGWTFRSGGNGPDAPSGSGLFRTADGGATWTELTPEANKGFPKKPYGRIAVAIAPSNAKRVYAFVEGTDSALFVSDDGGATWDKRDKSTWMVWRPFYFAKLVVDPKNADKVFKMNGAMIVSEDAGKSFSVVGGFTGMHGDVHDLWVDPANTQTVIAGDDGGMWYSYNGGSKWWKGENLPLSQFYHVSVDDADPYRVYGGLQDNSSWVGDSQYPGGITNSRWENMYGGDGFWMFSDPADPDYLYAEYQGGFIARVNRHTKEGRSIQPKPNYKEKLRWNWNTPIHLSPNEKGTIYVGAQFLFRSRNQGQSWDRISPDLTTNDPEKQQQEKSGGITVDNSAAEMHTTIYSISESPKDKNTIWVGTDDGNLQVTRDGGKTWTNVVGNITGLPKNSWVSWVQAGNFEPGTAYATFDRHTFGDMAPYAYRTDDFGKTWTPLTTPQDAKSVRGYAHVIKEDMAQKNLLFLGTEFGLFVSVDAGKSWAQFKGKRFPNVAVRDLAIHPRENDLILGTHGRGIWIVDDITPLRGLTADLLKQEASFVSARPVQQRLEGQGGWANGDAVFVGENPPDAAVITYYQRSRHLFGKLKIEVLDATGRVVDEIPASKRSGLNRVTWSMREKPPRVPPAAQLAFSGTRGPRLLPGTYTVRMTKAGKISEAKLTVGLDPRAKFNAADRKAQYDAAMKVHALFGQESALMDRIVGLRAATAKNLAAAPEGDALRKTLTDFDAKVDAVRKQIAATTEGGAITGEERLREHTDQLYGSILSYEGKPGDYLIANIESLTRTLGDVTTEFEQVTTKDLPAVNDALKAQGKEPLVVPPPKVADERTGSGSRATAASLPANFRLLH
ncbi:MAG: GH74 [uncultured Chthoniobacterales bacterium]|uniref:GH74 n=1 Tax=uncultured Chthoniobacterales bacterium TaxID=1836801 RepID=A0A6J4IZ76_9BACT|nr:MAG: GH74 [uncultured Chthoniobacterales bacterium]